MKAAFERMADTKGMERGAWLALRRQGIGGSDAAAILCANPWRTPLMVYFDKLEKVQEEPEQEESVALRFGRDCEEIVARWFCEDTGRRVRRENAILRSTARPWQLANVDRMVVGENAGLEYKTTSAFNRTDFAGGNIPPYYYWQCVHYMAVTGCEAWYLAVLHGNQGFWHYRIPRDEAAIDRLNETEAAFWQMVQDGTPPAPQGGDAETEMIAKTAGTEVPGVRAFLNPAQLYDYRLAKKAYESAKAAKEAIENDIKLQMGAADTGDCAGWKISYKTETRRTVDSKRLKTEAPDIFARYARETQSRVLRISET